jgi:hypothetical protein
LSLLEKAKLLPDSGRFSPLASPQSMGLLESSSNVLPASPVSQQV